MRTLSRAAPRAASPARSIGSGVTATATAALVMALFAALFGSSAAAADKPPPQPLRKDGLWRGTAGASLSAASGNTRSAAVLLKFDLARLTEGDKITLGANAHYARAVLDGEASTTAARAGGVGRYDFNLGPRLFAFGKLELERDDVLHLALRNNLGAGLGWKVIENEANRVSLFGGIARNDDRYDEPQTIRGRSARRFTRSSLLLAEESEHRLTSGLTVKQRLELQPAIGGDRSHLVNFSADASMALNSTISLTVGVLDRYDSAPPSGRVRNDFSVFTGLNVRLGAP